MEIYHLKLKKKDTQDLSSTYQPSKISLKSRKKATRGVTDIFDILIIDDEVSLGETLKDLLEDEGYTVALAINGEQGFKYLFENSCSIAIIDIVLPDTSGMEILKTINERKIDSIPIMLTAYATIETSIKALNEGAYAYIIKPYKFEDVKTTIRNALEKQRLSRENKTLVTNLKKANKDLIKVTKELEKLNRELEIKVRERTKELTKEKDKTNKILTCIADGLIVLDRELRIISFNKRAEEITGFKSSESIGKHCWEIFRHGNCENCLKEAIDINSPLVNVEKIIYTKDNRAISILSSIDVIKDKNGNLVGGVKTFRDISMLKQMQEELREKNMELLKNQRELKMAYKELKTSKEKLGEWADELDRQVQARTKELQEINERLRQANIRLTELDRLKSQFLATVTHEIKTPLTSIIGYTNLMMNHNNQMFNDQQMDILLRIQRNSQTLENLIEQLLDLSKIESGKIEVIWERFNLKDVIDEVINIAEPILMQKNIKARIKLPEQLPLIESDRAKVKQILLNLITNSVKFTEKVNSEITLKVKEKYNMITVSVKDQGIGISEEDQRIIFDPFRRANSLKSKKYSGTGLGLSIVKEFVNLLDGNVWVESKQDMGSTFYFTLPINRLTK